jgi:hypothetical protein
LKQESPVGYGGDDVFHLCSSPRDAVHSQTLDVDEREEEKSERERTRDFIKL